MWASLEAEHRVCVIRHETGGDVSQATFPPPVDEQRNVQWKWNIRAALMWFTIAACSESCSSLCFFQVSQEIMTSFLWTLVRKVWIEMVAGKARTRLSPNAVLLQHQLSALTQVSVPPGSLQTFLLYCSRHNRGWQRRRWRDRITCGVAFELEQNPQHTLACASVIRSTQRRIGLF